MLIKIKCRGHTLHRTNNTPIEVNVIEGEYLIKKIKNFLIDLFGNYHYCSKGVWSIFFFKSDECEISLPPEFLYDTIPNYYWG